MGRYNFSSRLPFSTSQARRVAKRCIVSAFHFIKRSGIAQIEFRPTVASSGVEVGDDHTLRIETEKLAASLTTVSANQRKLRIQSSPEKWFAQVLIHEAIHAADFQLADSRGRKVRDHFELLPDSALPHNWAEIACEIYGKVGFEPLPRWQQKAEFIRQVVEWRFTGWLTEQHYKRIKSLVVMAQIGESVSSNNGFSVHVLTVERLLLNCRACHPPLYLPSCKPRSGRQDGQSPDA